MSIKEKGYTHWEGELKGDRFSWKPISRYGIKLTFRKKFFKFSFFLTLVPALVYLVGIYVSERLEDFPFIARDVEAISFLDVTPKYFKGYFTNDFLLFMLVMIMVFCGAGLISNDLKYNSLQLYFSRPIKKKDYFMGKAAVIAFFLFLITLVPGIVFILMKLIFSGSFKFLLDYPWLFFSVVGYSVFITAFLAFYTLLLSSINKNQRYVAILIFGLYIFSDILFGIFYGIFRSRYFSLLSIKNNIQQVGAALFGQRAPYDISWIYSFLIITLFCVISGFILNKRVRGIEVVK
jgi:ABC-type transport system involved in multi-copper enzyme maturation permease subunit